MMTPTGSTHTKLGFWLRTLRTDCPEHPPYLVLIAAACALILCACMVTGACVFHIAKAGDIGSGACWALGLSVFSLAVVAGYSRFASPVGVVAPPVTGQAEIQPTVSNTGANNQVFDPMSCGTSTAPRDAKGGGNA